MLATAHATAAGPWLGLVPNQRQPYQSPRLRQFGVILLLARSPDGLTLAEIAKRLGEESTTIQGDIVTLTNRTAVLYEEDPPIGEDPDAAVRYRVLDPADVVDWLVRSGWPGA
jgi:hypothetical protein